MPHPRISKLTLRGFKSIREVDRFEFRDINVFIGANGAGKSNFISFFRFLSWMVQEKLQEHVGVLGSAHSILFDGPKTTPFIEASLKFRTDTGINDYYMRLPHAAGDSLIFVDERFRYAPENLVDDAEWSQLGSGHKETALVNRASENRTARFILHLLKSCVVYQFHDTSSKARIRQNWNVEDNIFLKEDGANIGPFLFRIQKQFPNYYRRIVETIRLIVPFFNDFELEDSSGNLPLRWTENDSDQIFHASQASDGMLRAITLVGLLLQPPDRLPNVLILDEPELGLHPYAISIIAGLIKSVSVHRQVLIATQSTVFIECFDAEDIVTVNRVGRESIFNRLDLEALSEWLENYSVAELWEKNVIGGRPV